MLSFIKFTDEMRHALDCFAKQFDRERLCVNLSGRAVQRPILKDLAARYSCGKRILSSIFVQMKNLCGAFQ